MRLVGVLSWYDESPGWLAAAVSGFARVCDQIVAVDGAYALYPGARARSRPDQAEAVLHAAEALGAGCTIHRPANVFWGNEVEKRNLTLQLAAPFLTEMEDWVVVFDADCHVLQVNPAVVRDELERTDLHVATYTTLDGQDLLSGSAADFAQHVDVDTEWTVKSRHIYRWIPGLHYGPTHYSISGTVDGLGVWLRGATADEIAPALDLGSALAVHHRSSHRAKVRRDASAGYSHLKNEKGIEHVADSDMLVT